MNFGRLRFVAERADVGERREVLMSVRVPEKPGRWVLFSSASSQSPEWRQLFEIPLPPRFTRSHRVLLPPLQQFHRLHHLLLPPLLLILFVLRALTRSARKRDSRDGRIV